SELFYKSPALISDTLKSLFASINRKENIWDIKKLDYSSQSNSIHVVYNSNSNFIKEACKFTRKKVEIGTGLGTAGLPMGGSDIQVVIVATQMDVGG
ncbi:6069_t:CDS:2, partial [Ambispora gerdemannii]